MSFVAALFRTLALLALVLAGVAQADDRYQTVAAGSASTSSSIGVTAAGISGSLQFRDGTGAFNGRSNLVTDGSGNVAIGTSTPTVALQVSGSFIVSQTQQTTTPTLYTNSSGQVGIGTNAPNAALGVNGLMSASTATINGLLTASSGISNSGNSSVAGNLQVSGSFAVTGFAGVGISATVPLEVVGPISGTRVLVSGTGAEISATTPSANSVFTVARTGANAGSLTINFSNGRPTFIINGIFTPLNFGSAGGGMVTIGSGALPSSTLHVIGTLTATGGISFTGLATGTALSNLCIAAGGGVVSTTSLSGCLGVSDPFAKGNLKPLAYGLAEILKLDTVTYRDLREGAFEGEQVGVLAYGVDREGHHFTGLQELMPMLVSTGGPWHGRLLKAAVYERLPVVLINAVKTLHADIVLLGWLLVLVMLWLAAITGYLLRRTNR